MRKAFNNLINRKLQVLQIVALAILTALAGGCSANGGTIGDNGTPAHVVIDNQAVQPITINLYITSNNITSNFTWSVQK